MKIGLYGLKIVCRPQGSESKLESIIGQKQHADDLCSEIQDFFEEKLQDEVLKHQGDEGKIQRNHFNRSLLILSRQPDPDH